MACIGQRIKVGFLAILVLGCTISSGLALAESGDQNSEPALTAAELNSISSNCQAIKHSLSQLQKVDSKTRTYLGTTYETIANKFITPLNLRLVRNNRPTFSAIQTDFFTEQANFRSHYTEYMRELESLIATDCQANPEHFYQQLTTVRNRRAKVRLTTEKLKALTTAQYQAVNQLRKELP